MKKIFLVLVIPVLIILLDQWTKYLVDSRFYVGESLPVIRGFFNLTYVRNPGAAFGFGGEFSNWLRYSMFRGLPVAACIWLIWTMVKTKSPLILDIAYSFILGGAVGNLIDRFRLDFVIDMFDFYFQKSHFATFNVADSFISTAAVFIVIDSINQKMKRKTDKMAPV